MVDSHGDIWMQLVAAASRDPDMFHGNCDQIEAQMLDALELDRDAGFPKRRLVTIWRNKRWRAMTTEWCQTTVGRTTFQISTWDWMICFRIDDVRGFGPGALGSLADRCNSSGSRPSAKS